METTAINETSTSADINAIIESTVQTTVSEPLIVETPKPEPESELAKTIRDASLSVLLRIVASGQLSSATMPLDKTTTAILLELLDKKPKTFDNIQESVQFIVQDGKLNAADIPHLYKLVTELYPLVKHSKLRPSTLDCANIVGTVLKVVIHVLVNERKIKVSNPEQFIQQLDKLVDSAIELVSLAKSLKTPKCLKIFRRK